MTSPPMLYSEDKRIVYVACSPEFVKTLSKEWHGPAQFRIENGQLIFRTVDK